MLRGMEEPSAAAVAGRLRELLPTGARAEFDDDISAYAEPDGDVSVCGVLIAFGTSFRLLIRGGDVTSIRDTLAYLDDLLVRYKPEVGAPPSGHGVYNSLLSCFFENVLPVRPEEFAYVGPFLGPGVRAHCAEFEPSWLEPDPHTSPA